MYKFEPLTNEHFKIFFQWLQSSHIQKWWDSETSWEQFENRYNKMIFNPFVFPHIVFKDDTPIGYINYWFVEEDPNYKLHFPNNTVGTDQFIGAPELIGKGIGSEFIRIFTDSLLLKPNIELVITDPNTQNIHAIHAFEKAGFVKTKILTTPEGDEQILEKRNGTTSDETYIRQT